MKREWETEREVFVCVLGMLEQSCDRITVSEKNNNCNMQRIMFTEACKHREVAGRIQAHWKFSLINAPRDSIVINGDEMEEGSQGGVGEAV